MEYSIVIPAYNEENKIIATVNKVLIFMREFSKAFEIIVVDDGSKDRTVELVKSVAAENPEIIVIANPHKGKGPTVTTGILSSAGEYVYMCDADLSTPISELRKLSHWIKEQGYDIVIGSREGAGAVRENEPFIRHFIGRGFNFGVQLLLLKGIKDSQCGFKLFKGEVAHDIFSHLRVYKPPTHEIKKAFMGAFDVEFLTIALKKGYKVKELPVYWKHEPTTRLSVFSDSVQMAFDVVRIWMNSISGKYI